MQRLNLIAIAVVLWGDTALTETPDSKATSTPTALSKEEDEKAWSFSAAASTYIVPDDQEYVQPTFSADRDWLHLEARYNYENLKRDRRGSATISAAGKIRIEFADVGWRVWEPTGIAPGYELSLTY